MRLYCFHVSGAIQGFMDGFLGWDNIKNSLTCDEATYLDLINNFKDHGQFDDADDCYYLYRLEKMSQSNGYEFFWDMLSFITCGYGVRWINTLVFSILILFSFGVFFSRDCSWDLKEALNISIAVLLFLPLEWRPSKRAAYTNLIEKQIYAATLERLIGWSLLSIPINQPKDIL